ncbi:MAG: chemotaxis protein CheW [Shimia sp.]
MEMLSFTLDGELYATDIMSVREIREWSPPTPLPLAPRGVDGVINLRGRILPVVDLAAMLALPPAKPETRPAIIVFDDRGQPFGGVVEAVRDIIRIDPAQITDPPMGRDTRSIGLSGLYLEGKDVVRILDLDGLAPQTEPDPA